MIIINAKNIEIIVLIVNGSLNKSKLIILKTIIPIPNPINLDCQISPLKYNTIFLTD